MLTLLKLHLWGVNSWRSNPMLVWKEAKHQAKAHQILLMVQKSGIHQLRYLHGIYPINLQGLKDIPGGAGVVVQEFWTINSITFFSVFIMTFPSYTTWMIRLRAENKSQSKQLIEWIQIRYPLPGKLIYIYIYKRLCICSMFNVQAFRFFGK